MPLSQRSIEKLKAIWKQESGEEITDAEAWDMATRLLCFFEALLPDAVPLNHAPVDEITNHQTL